MLAIPHANIRANPSSATCIEYLLLCVIVVSINFRHLSCQSTFLACLCMRHMWGLECFSANSAHMLLFSSFTLQTAACHFLHGGFAYAYTLYSNSWSEWTCTLDRKRSYQIKLIVRLEGGAHARHPRASACSWNLQRHRRAAAAVISSMACAASLWRSIDAA